MDDSLHENSLGKIFASVWTNLFDRVANVLFSEWQAFIFCGAAINVSLILFAYLILSGQFDWKAIYHSVCILGTVLGRIY